jgi:hypothetical protein
MDVIDANLIADLRRHAERHQLDQTAQDAVKQWLARERKLTIDASKVEARFNTRSLCFESSRLGHGFIVSQYEIIYEESRIGYYRLISTLDGRIDDDYFVLDNLP